MKTAPSTSLVHRTEEAGLDAKSILVRHFATALILPVVLSLNFQDTGNVSDELGDGVLNKAEFKKLLQKSSPSTIYSDLLVLSVLGLLLRGTVLPQRPSISDFFQRSTFCLNS